MSLRLTIQPTAHPVTLLEAARHLKLADTEAEAQALEEKPLLEALIATVTEQAEAETNRQLMEATYEYRLDTFQGLVELPKYPAKEVVKVEYVNAEGGLTTLPDSEYLLDTGAKPCRLILNNPGDVKPTLATLRITYVAGGEVPAMCKSGMLLLLANYYENREEVIVGTISGKLPVGAQRCFELCKVEYFA
jgi:uncharacterized phiE125 gp8 family phage protein